MGIVGFFRIYAADIGYDFVFYAEQDITSRKYVEQLKGFEKAVFQKLYAGKFSKKLYKLYEFKK